jgi:hypothetical protein
MVWLLLAIPAATVVAGMATLRIARAGGQDAEPEPVRRTLQAQEADLAPDARAARLHLQARVHVDAGRVQVDAPAQAAGDALTLRLVHPTRAEQDLAWTRDAGAGTWRGPPFPAATRGRWILEDRTQGWRLVGRWTDARGDASLRPAVALP